MAEKLQLTNASLKPLRTGRAGKTIERREILKLSPLLLAGAFAIPKLRTPLLGALAWRSPIGGSSKSTPRLAGGAVAGRDTGAEIYACLVVGQRLDSKSLSPKCTLLD
ncbi:MAG: hypothetical protein ACYDD2_15675 [Candidatus Acidiferrales bacterium]